MFRAVLFASLFALGLAALVAVVAEPAEGDRPEVIAEPLNCQQIDQQVVCTDRHMHGEAVCSRLDETTVYCTTRASGGAARAHVVAAAAAGVPKL